LIEAAQAISPAAGEILKYLAMPSHYNDFARGAVNLEDVIYYVSVTVVALFMATRTLETRRYR